MKECRTCKILFERTSDNFHRNKANKDGFHLSCKACRNKEGKIRYENSKNQVKVVYVEVTPKPLSIPKFKLNEVYKIKHIKNDTRKLKKGRVFEGVCIYHDKRLLTLRKSDGVTETFLKVDFGIGEYEVI